MIAINPAAAIIHAIQMRAFAEEGRLCGTLEIPPLLETIENIEGRIQSHTVITAKDGERLVGSARGLVDGRVCTIRGVSVEPTYQGQGIGGVLLQAVEQAVGNVDRFELTTNTLVPGNVEFYEKPGYRVDELTKYGEKIVLAQMSKTSPTATV